MRSPIVTQLEALIQQRGSAIADWFIESFRQHPPGIYSSVDLRHSGVKVVPVDTNLFPAGFNNLSDAARERAAISFKRYLHLHWPLAKKLLLIPENHTRNLAYLENVRVLQQLLERAGFNVVLGRVEENLAEPLTLETRSGQSIVQQPLQRVGDRLLTRDGYEADLLIINNDLTAGVPPLLAGVAQPMTPEPIRGWHARRKSQHFQAYCETARDFATAFDFDPWLISAVNQRSEGLDFKQRQGLEGLQQTVAEVLAKIGEKYKQHGIAQTPYVFLKADAGTYGMGIMTVQRPEEVLELNKKARNKMDVIKEGTQVTEVLVQEGIPTIDTVGGAPAEPMLYLVGGMPVGGAYRYNPERDVYGNLNAQGMQFTGMCDAHEDESADYVRVENCNFSVFGLIARLATLAAARE